MEPEPSGAAFFCLEPEPTQCGRSRSRLRDLGLAEPPKKWRLCNTDCMVYRLKYTFTRLAYTTYPFSFISGADCVVENLPEEWLNLLDCGDLLFCSTAPGSHNSMPDLSGVRYRYPTVDFFLVNIDTYRYW